MSLPDLTRSLSIPTTALRIGVVGGGRKARDLYVPAYEGAGLTVQAFAEPRADASDDALALVARDDLDVIHLLTPEEGRLPIVEAVARAGKHLLVEAPPAADLDTARRMVEIAAAANVRFAVNHGARWSPAARAVRALLDADTLGRPWLIRFEMVDDTDSRVAARTSPHALESRYRVLRETIHALDLVRHWMGCEPERVWCVLPRRPGQKFRGELTASITLEFTKGRHAQLLDHGASLPGRESARRFMLEGTHGVVEGDLARTDRFAVRLARDEQMHRPALGGDAAGDPALGPMADLLEAIESGREPVSSGADHLQTLALVEACYRSAESGMPVTLA